MKKLQELSFMVIDDVPNMRRTIRNMLNRMGIKRPIMEADDGDKAWAKLENAPVDFVICDWNMPRMTGIELLRKMRETPKFAEIPFLMLTGEVDEGTIAQAAETEIDAYIIKPFVMKTLIEKIEEALRVKYEPTEVEFMFREGVKQFKKGNVDEAFELFKRVRAKSPRAAKVYVGLGDVYFVKRDIGNAKKMYQAALKLSNQYVKAMDQMAKIFEIEGKKEQRAEFLQRAAQISPEVSERQLELGKAMFAVGNKEMAVKALKISLKKSPEDPDLASAVGEVFLSANMEDEASNAFRRSIRVAPENMETYNRLGISLRKQKKYLEAIKEYQKALKYDPKNEIILYNLSIAYFQRGLHGESKNALIELLKINPQHLEAQKALQAIESGSTSA